MNSAIPPDLHEVWLNTYYSGRNVRFYDEAFDYILRVLTPAPGATFLDAGCGNGTHTVRLAQQGYPVVAVDCSAYILKKAESLVQDCNLSERVKFQQGDVTHLSFPNAQFEYVLCWGVLMHIPQVEQAIQELVRVTKPGGAIIISEANMHSLQSIVKLWRHRESTQRTRAGRERWQTNPEGALLVRESDIGWLIRQFKVNSAAVEHHLAGQFSEFYAWSSQRLIQEAAYAWNELWFRYVRFPQLAFGNILIFRKAP